MQRWVEADQLDQVWQILNTNNSCSVCLFCLAAPHLDDLWRQSRWWAAVWCTPPLPPPELGSSPRRTCPCRRRAHVHHDFSNKCTVYLGHITLRSETHLTLYLNRTHSSWAHVQGLKIRHVKHLYRPHAPVPLTHFLMSSSLY